VSAPSRALVVHVRGDDPTLVRDAVRRVVDELVGEADRELAVDDFAGEDYELASAVVAARTPPFLTEHRVVVARDLERFKADELAPLLAYLGDLEESTSLVLVHGPGAGRLPKAFLDALKSAGAETVDAGRPSSGKARQQWVDDALSLADVRLDVGARALVAEQLGDDVARLPAVLDALVASFGPGARLGAGDVAPFLGEVGSVPPWELTDAIDRGDAAAALDKLTRMLGAGGRHPLQLMVTLHAHVERWLRLHGSGASSEADAADLLGLKSRFPARKALDRTRAMGGARIGRAVELLAEADLQLKGAIAWPPEQVLEVLVVRLARLAR
jgi:DNA polymerase-3 subunit delta